MTSLEVVALVAGVALVLGYIVAEEDESAVGAVADRTGRAADGLARNITGQRLLAGGGFLGGLVMGEQVLAALLGFLGGVVATGGLGGGLFSFGFAVSPGMIVVGVLVALIVLGYYGGGR